MHYRLVAACALVAVQLMLWSFPSLPARAANTTPDLPDTLIPIFQGQGDRPQLFIEPATPLSLDQALRYTLAYNQELAVAERKILASRAAALQAGLLPNPELGVDLDGFAGRQDRTGFNSAETTVSVSQLIELGGKRTKRRRASRAAARAMAWQYRQQKLKVSYALIRAFGDVLAGQEAVTLASRQLRLAEQVLVSVQARVEAGKVSPVEETKAQVALAASRIKLERARRELESRRRSLSTFWENPEPAFTKVQGRPADLLPPLPSLEKLLKHLDNHPEIARRKNEVEQSRYELQLALAGRIPDLTVSGGMRYYQESENNALVASLSMPLTLFNRNQGAIAEARQNLAQATARLAVSRTRLQTALHRAYQELLTARAEVRTISEKMLPGADRAFEAAREGYQQGKFSYLEILDAQQTLFTVAADHLDTLQRLLAADIEVRKLAGLGLFTSIPQETAIPHP